MNKKKRWNLLASWFGSGESGGGGGGEGGMGGQMIDISKEIINL